MKKKIKWSKALFICFCISLLFIVIDYVNEPQIESVAEGLFIVTGCTLSFYMWYGLGALVCKYIKNQQAVQEGRQNNSVCWECKQIVSTAIIDVQYKTKVKTNYPKALALSMLGKRAYGHIGGILGGLQEAA